MVNTLWPCSILSAVCTAASLVSAHRSSIVRTFALTRSIKRPTDEPIGSYLNEYASVSLSPKNDSSHPEPFVFWRPEDPFNEANETWPSRRISDQARQFLTGPLSTVFIPSLYTLVCLVSLPLNAVALVTFARQVRPVKPAVVFMLNLAAADLLFALLLPFRIHYHFSGNHWTLGPALCRVVTATFYCNMHCSVLLIACISVDRLLAVVYPIRSLGWRRPRHAAGACGAAWALALAGSVPLALSEQTVRLDELGITTCHDVQEVEQLRWRYAAYFCTVAVALFLLPMLVTLGCYARVIWALRRVPDKVGHNSRRKARAMSMALVVLLLFLVCFAPTNCLLLLHYLQFSSLGGGEEGAAEGQQAPDGSYAAYLVFLCVGSLNCCLDPLVYYFGSSQCQRQLSATLGCRKGLDSGRKNIYSCSSSSSSRTALRSSQNGFTSVKAKPAVHKLDSFQASLDSQYKKLLV
ncbi:unnamed protein product [Lota lota]